MTEGIKKIIEEIVEPKIETTFTDKIDAMVNKDSKQEGTVLEILLFEKYLLCISNS